MKTNNKQIAEMRKLFSEGVNKRRIAERLELKYSMVVYWLNESTRERTKARAMRWFKNLPPKRKKEMIERKKEYIKHYMRNRYHSDPEFRRKMLDRAMEYQRRKKNG